MFENCGKKIQGISGFLLVVGMIATIILAIVFGKSGRHFDFWRFIAILAGGGFTVYVDALFLNGFGLIVENNEAQRIVLEQPKKVSKGDREKEILDEGGWKCVCGRVNYHYVSSCACGKNRREGEVKNRDHPKVCVNLRCGVE